MICDICGKETGGNERYLTFAFLISENSEATIRIVLCDNCYIKYYHNIKSLQDKLLHIKQGKVKENEEDAKIKTGTISL